MVNFELVSKTYPKSSVRAVDELSLTIEPGLIHGFLGPNGAGKTTTIKMMAGILPFEEGKITICGYDIKYDPINAKKQIGYITDSGVLYDKLTGREYIDLMADIYGVSLEDRRARADRLLELFNLTGAVDKQIGTFSHGMVQKIAIIGAMIHQPKVLVLDEPMTGLDPQSVRDLKNIMREHADAGNVVFFSTHVLDTAEKICDRISIINHGRIIMSGDLDEIKSAKGDESLEDIFLSVAGGENG
ncbi:MAG: ABC transporter ATP-binding protein [Clostridia bacterium]|nr:ABC transporter ATP-binding protein [Clostridia bacterium]